MLTGGARSSLLLKLQSVIRLAEPGPATMFYRLRTTQPAL